MENDHSGQDPQKEQTEALLSATEEFLRDAADKDIAAKRDMMLGLESSADFSRSLINALQVSQGCFDRASMDEVVLLNDMAIRIFTPSDIQEIAFGEETPSYKDTLHAFASGLAGLHVLLHEKDKEIHPDLLEMASEIYNGTFGCLAQLLTPDEEAFQRTSNELEFYLAPLTVGVLEFDEDGFAFPPEPEITVQDIFEETVNGVHDEFWDKINDALPIHDSNMLFLGTTTICVDSTVELMRECQLRADTSGEDVAEHIQYIRDSAVDSHLDYCRRNEYQMMTDEAADDIRTLMTQYIDSLLRTYQQFDNNEGSA